jgi:tripartite-type tricarboxylate transporter receptor subunit TctC
MISKARSFSATAVILLTCALSALADEFPSRPITLVVGLGAGGGTDINARIYAEVLSRNLGQRVLVDNRTGAGGAVAAASVQQAAPDGYTLLVISGLQHAYVPATQASSYEPVSGFSPITLAFEIVSTLAVPEESEAKTAAEFVSSGMKKSGGLTVGAPGPGSPPHLFGALISEATGLPVRVAQYRGSTTIMADLAANRIDFAFPTYGLGKPFFDSKKVRPLAVAAEQRWSEFPELPTLLEAGLIKQSVAMWFGIVAPRDVPGPIVKRLNDAFVSASRDPELVKRFTTTGTAIRTSSAEEMKRLMLAENEKVASLVARLGLRQ